MSNLDKYKGIIPAFYACYDEDGKISPQGVQNLAKHYLDIGVKGLYVGGSSGECIYQSIDERKLVLENVMEAVGGKMTIIAHVAAPSTNHSIELAKHAAQLDVDALAAIPPIYFTLPEHAIVDYWQAMVDAVDKDFIIYNIPQTTGYKLSTGLLTQFADHPRVIGVKNSSLDVQDFYLYRKAVQKDFIIFNGSDEQYIAGRIMGADGGIGGTYGVMPELYMALEKALQNGDINLAREIQFSLNDIIFKMVSFEGNLYDVQKLVLREKGLDIGRVRAPLPKVTSEEMPLVKEVSNLIETSIQKYC